MNWLQYHDPWIFRSMRQNEKINKFISHSTTLHRCTYLTSEPQHELVTVVVESYRYLYTEEIPNNWPVLWPWNKTASGFHNMQFMPYLQYWKRFLGTQTYCLPPTPKPQMPPNIPDYGIWRSHCTWPLKLEVVVVQKNSLYDVAVTMPLSITFTILYIKDVLYIWHSSFYWMVNGALIVKIVTLPLGKSWSVSHRRDVH